MSDVRKSEWNRLMPSHEWKAIEQAAMHAAKGRHEEAEDWRADARYDGLGQEPYRIDGEGV